MVFESVVADLLNSILGTYVDNLNASQLNIGIWGGDVKLNHLVIKGTALDGLNLPVKLSFGYIQSLILKIPWKNLYVEPTIMEISGIYLIIVPNQGIIYNKEKAHKNDQEAKQKQLMRLEENRRNRQKPNIPSDDTFTEKLLAQIIKNLQVHVKRVHIRYEDKFSNRDRPFATGITLDSLDFQTTDENFKLIVQRETVKIFYKLVSMNSLGIYSNANSTLISDLKNKKTIISALRKTIAVNEQKPEGYKYVLEPLTISSQLKLNQKPESDGSNWNTPKIDLSMQLDKLGLAIGQHQYQDMLLFLEAQERFTLAEKYLKHRPNLTQYRQHYTEWWHFAYNCILNEQVKRRRNNWSWTRMRAHRQLVRDYQKAWIHFRTHKTPRKKILDKIEEAEDALDVFNLNIARQQAEFEIDKQSLVRVEDQPNEGWIGWAKGWWFGSSPKAKEGTAQKDAQIFDKLEKEVTPKEKERLFDAIDYQENIPPTDYPKHFVENFFKLNLKTLMLKLDDVMEMHFSHLSAKLEQRPAANALRFSSAVKSLEMRVGIESMLHMTETDRAWLTMEFETNPLEGGFDQRMSLNIAPVMFKYHAPAVNRALEVFKPPKSVRLHQLTTLAIARYEDVKARSATALQHMIDERKKLKLEVKIDPTIFVVSFGGAFDPTKTTLIAELGQLQLNTLSEPATKAYQHITDQKLRSLVAKAYDNFQLCLTNLRLIFSDSFDNCMKAREDRLSDDHLLKPTGMCIDMLLATIDDVQIPMFRLIGELPDVVLTISDDRLVELLEFFNSIPRPDFEEEAVDLSAAVPDGTTLRDRDKMQKILATEELSEEIFQTAHCCDDTAKKATEVKRAMNETKESASREQQIQVDINLQLNKVGVVVKHRHSAFLSAQIHLLQFRLCKRMYDMEIYAHMDSVSVRASPAAVSLLNAVNAKLAEHQKIKNQRMEDDRNEHPNYWTPKQIERANYWWFEPIKRTSGTDAINLKKDTQEDTQIMRKISELVEFSIRSCLITVETGTRDVTRPMILIESSVAGTARNWSSTLTAKCEAQLIVSYFNETYNVWEPVIEPVLHEDKGWQNWKLAFKIGPQGEDEADQLSNSLSTSKQKKDKGSSKDAKVALPPPKLVVTIEATETLDITITNSFLQQLNQLSQELENSAKRIGAPRRISGNLLGTPSHLLRNDTALTVRVCTTKSLMVLSSRGKQCTFSECSIRKYIPMKCVTPASRESNWRMKEDQRKIELKLTFADLDTERTVNIARTEKQYIDLPREADSGKKWAFVVETVREDAWHVITLKSFVTVMNHLEIPIEVQARHNSNCLPCGTAKAKGAEPLNIPVPCLYTPNGQLQIRPADGRHEWNKENISWLNLDSVKRQTVLCGTSDGIGKGIFIEMVAVGEPIRRGNHYFVDTNCVAYTIHLFPPIHFINTLPIPVQIWVPIQCELAAGEGLDLVNLVAGCPLVFTINIGTEEYQLKYTVPHERKSLETIRLEGKTNSRAELCLGFNWSTEFLRTNLLLYAPYWMVNETDKQLAYYCRPSTSTQAKAKCCCCSKGCCYCCCSKGKRSRRNQSKIHHPPGANPMILPLHENEFGSKDKKAKVKIVGCSKWSAQFPLDMAGSSGRVICKSIDGGQRAFMTVEVNLGQSGLTKVVTFSPFFLLKNDGKIDFEVREPHTSNWILVPAETVIGFWPVQKGKRKTLVARYARYAYISEESVPFPFTEAFEGFCLIKNNMVGLYVIVSLSDDSSVIHLDNFQPGMAPAILMNDTKYPIRYRQATDEHWQQILPNEFAPFAWIDSMKDCKLEWNSGEAANSDELLRNRDLSYLPSKNENRYHYVVSFLDGRQRILLFTADDKVSFVAHQAYELEQPSIEMELYLHGIGISLVNNLKSLEVLYMAISPPKREKCEEVPLKMTTAFWCQYRQTIHQQTLHVKLHSFQIDNQLPASTFPSMLAMIPQPRSVVRNEPKPFLECSFVMSQSGHSNIVEIKLLEALVQEFAIRLDRTLINELLDMMPTENKGYTHESFYKDMELTHNTLVKRAIHARVTQARAYYHRMHISPLMVHLSFSQGHGGKGMDRDGIHWEFLNLILKSVGVTLTEVQDVVFKLAFFQREAIFYSRAQLESEVQTHYIRQFIKQLHVLVLGLDILGNPFGLVRDLRTGAVDLFYQPVRGMVTGPADFGKGVYIGLTSLFSHTVGGVLGLATRITSTMGKGMAALTLDEDYQRRRMQAKQQPTSIGKGMLRGVRGVGTGVVEGVTGIVSKPVQGVKQGGLLGGIKGIGKGMVGVIARPVSGVVDLVTTTADNVRNAIRNDIVKPIRPPRVISHDKIIRPYVFEEAIGYKIFRETERGHFADTDHYLTYGPVTKQLVIIVTDKHIIEARQHKLTGNWSADWSPEYAELNKPKRVKCKGGKFGIKLRLKKAKTGFCSSSAAKGKIVQFGAERVAGRVLENIVRVWEYGAAD